MYHLIAILLFSTAFSYGQIHEFGLFLGGANAIADVGSEKYINPNTLAIGGIYKWNRSPRHSFRFSALFSDLRGADSKSNESRRKTRDFSFKNEIKELTAGMEFTFWDFDLHDQHNYAVKTTPYLFTGLSFFNYKALALNSTNEIVSYDTHNSLAIPMVVGLKTAITNQIVIGAEIGARYTFTDDIDGSNPVKDKNEMESLKFGNINSNDWYVFTGVTLTYTFGKNPCFCNTN
jgi:opacity protein-like surface antigen